MPTIGTLSGSVATLLKLGSRYDRAKKRTPEIPRTMPPRFVQIGRKLIATTSRRRATVTRYWGADRKLTTLLAALMINIGATSSHRPRNAAVLADPPEMDRHQEGGDERNSHAVQHVEAQERSGPDEPATEKREPRVVRRRHELDVADLEQPCGGSLDPDQRRRGRHVRADRDRPARQLVPREQGTGE